jgi:hypothetical protein
VVSAPEPGARDRRHPVPGRAVQRVAGRGGDLDTMRHPEPGGPLGASHPQPRPRCLKRGRQCQRRAPNALHRHALHRRGRSGRRLGWECHWESMEAQQGVLPATADRDSPRALPTTLPSHLASHRASEPSVPVRVHPVLGRRILGRSADRDPRRTVDRPAVDAGERPRLPAIVGDCLPAALEQWPGARRPLRAPAYRRGGSGRHRQLPVGPSAALRAGVPERDPVHQGTTRAMLPCPRPSRRNPEGGRRRTASRPCRAKRSRLRRRCRHRYLRLAGCSRFRLLRLSFRLHSHSPAPDQPREAGSPNGLGRPRDRSSRCRTKARQEFPPAAALPRPPFADAPLRRRLASGREPKPGCVGRRPVCYATGVAGASSSFNWS